jgi:uncharacterized protein YodC (DUF2158 family)
MEKERLKIGNFVEFLSGGPTMTIIQEGAGLDWRRGWFAGDEYKVADFDSTVLKKVTQPKAYKGLL